MGKPARNTSAAAVRVSRVDYWPAAATAFSTAVAVALASVIMAGLLWFVLSSIGIFAQIDGKLQAVAGEGAFQLEDYLTFSKVVGVTGVLSLLLVGLSPLIGLASAAIYNGAARFTGGLRVRLTSTVLTEDEPAPGRRSL